MSFQDAVTTVFTKKYLDFSGRARRSEYWFAWLAVFVVSIVLQIIGKIIGTQLITFLFDLAILLPGLGVAVRRLQDTDRSGWWLLIGLTGIGLFVLLFWFVTEGQPGDNQYGPSPKGAAELNPASNAN